GPARFTGSRFKKHQAGICCAAIIAWRPLAVAHRDGHNCAWGRSDLHLFLYSSPLGTQRGARVFTALPFWQCSFPMFDSWTQCMCNLYAQTKSQDAMRHVFDHMRAEGEALVDL